ncbi:MAG: TetR/AcrR family transcriptional regulator [Akkermansiaceae bacterium]|nr:TetR/AcrR family transcriptional regulator [Akkermansiaceae bacterium]
MPRRRDPARTRRKLLAAGYREFYRHGFQGGSLKRIVESAGITKGALFHHFAGKKELGYAVLEEFLYPAVKSWWVEPLAASDDPVPVMQSIFGRFRKLLDQEKAEEGYLFNGCPICNYAAEMAPLDDGFRERLDRLYTAWRRAISTALKRGQDAGRVRADIRPADEAAFLVAAFAGTAATGKVTRKAASFHGALRAIDRHLEGLRA